MMIVESIFDYKAYKAFFIRDSLRLTVRTGVLLVITLASVGMSAYFFALKQTTNALLFLLVAGIIPFIYLYGRITQFFRTMKDSGLRTKSAKIRYEINKERILVVNRTTGVQRTFKWAEVKRLTEGKDYFFLYLLKDNIIVFAKTEILEGSGKNLTEYAQAARRGRKKKTGVTLKIG